MLNGAWRGAGWYRVQASLAEGSRELVHESVHFVGRYKRVLLIVPPSDDIILGRAAVVSVIAKSDDIVLGRAAVVRVIAKSADAS
jgi:hypothetical protein